MEKVFREIKKQTGYLFVYRDEWLKETGKVDIDVKEGTLEDVLKLCFDNQPFTYVINKQSILITPKRDSNEPTPVTPVNPVAPVCPVSPVTPV